jgi:hypothetical protein
MVFVTGAKWNWIERRKRNECWTRLKKEKADIEQKDSQPQ